MAVSERDTEQLQTENAHMRDQLDRVRMLRDEAIHQALKGKPHEAAVWDRVAWELDNAVPSTAPVGRGLVPLTSEWHTPTPGRVPDHVEAMQAIEVDYPSNGRISTCIQAACRVDWWRARRYRVACQVLDNGERLPCVVDDGTLPTQARFVATDSGGKAFAFSGRPAARHHEGIWDYDVSPVRADDRFAALGVAWEDSLFWIYRPGATIHALHPHVEN